MICLLYFTGRVPAAEAAAGWHSPRWCARHGKPPVRWKALVPSGVVTPTEGTEPPPAASEGKWPSRKWKDHVEPVHSTNSLSKLYQTPKILRLFDLKSICFYRICLIQSLSRQVSIFNIQSNTVELLLSNSANNFKGSVGALNIPVILGVLVEQISEVRVKYLKIDLMQSLLKTSNTKTH